MEIWLIYNYILLYIYYNIYIYTCIILYISPTNWTNNGWWILKLLQGQGKNPQLNGGLNGKNHRKERWFSSHVTRIRRLYHLYHLYPKIFHWSRDLNTIWIEFSSNPVTNPAKKNQLLFFRRWAKISPSETLPKQRMECWASQSPWSIFHTEPQVVYVCFSASKSNGWSFRHGELPWLLALKSPSSDTPIVSYSEWCKSYVSDLQEKNKTKYPQWTKPPRSSFL